MCNERERECGFGDLDDIGKDVEENNALGIWFLICRINFFSS